jgi:hypothetical protein
MYTIRFEGITSTSVCARSLQEALEIARMFEQRGMTNIVISERDTDDKPQRDADAAARQRS